MSLFGWFSRSRPSGILYIVWFIEIIYHLAKTYVAKVALEFSLIYLYAVTSPQQDSKKKFILGVSLTDLEREGCSATFSFTNRPGSRRDDNV